MLEKLGNVLKKATDKIANAIFLDKDLVDSIIKDLQRALIEADVNVKLVKDLSDHLKQVAYDERLGGVEKKEHLIKVLHDELLKILGDKKELIIDPNKQNRIMLLGLYGAGKTTTISKLGNYYSKRGKKVALVGLDVHRPAANEQLKQLAEKNKLNYFIDLNEKDPVKIWKSIEPKLVSQKFDIVLIDTAGRHTLDDELIEELSKLNKIINPTEKILVMPADIGQAAKQQTDEFHKTVDISGVIITRMDSTAKGGGSLTACAQTKAPVYFITTGEKVNDIELFNPESFLSRLLGMGDLAALIEKVKSAGEDNNKSQAMQKRIEEGKLTLDDVVEQIKTMSSIGGLSKIKTMIPGFSKIEGKVSDDILETQEEKIKKWEHIIKSMTPYEKENPESLEDKKTGISRINRIAKGAGVHNSDIKSLLKQYKMLKEMIQMQGAMSGDIGQNSEEGMLSQKQMMKLARKFGKGKKFKM